MTDHLDVDRIDALAAIIREVDGNHSLGASKLAEAIMSHHLVIDVQIAGAMRPQVVDLPQANSDVCGEEGMERALQRTFEENDELMRKLSDS